MSYPVRPDPVNGKRLMRAVMLFVVAMLCVLGSFAWTIATRQGPEAGGPQSLSVCCALLLVFAAVTYVLYARLRMGALNRCPQCGTRIKSPPTPGQLHRPGRLTVTTGSTGARPVPPRGAGRRVLHSCDVCRITWDTGWRVGRRPGMD